MSGVSKLAHGKMTKVSSCGQRKLWMSKYRYVVDEISAKKYRIRHQYVPVRMAQGKLSSVK